MQQIPGDGSYGRHQCNQDLVLGCVGGVGVIFLAWGLLDFGTGYSAHDTTQQSQAIKKVIGGLVMIAVPAILKLLGVS